MISKRSVFYWLWFLTFGLTATLACILQEHQINSENFWLFGVSFLGLLTSTKDLEGSVARPFDIAVGLTFMTVGLVGVFHNFGLGLYDSGGLVGAFINNSCIIGLSLALMFALLHVFVGFWALAHALKSPSTYSTLMANSKE